MDKDNDMILKKTRLRNLSWCHIQSRPGQPSLLRRFSYKDVKKATDGFRRDFNNAPQGNAYNAKFYDGFEATVKEVKVFYEDDDAFCRDVQLLGCLNHRHIVALRGFCTGSKRFLVYENMEEGSLKEHLCDPLKTPLNWRTRLQIATGIAAALEYLFFFCEPLVYHVSISSSTILLDENLIAKISDVSLLKAARRHVSPPTVSDCAKGQERNRNIIFQLGLVILELVTGQSSGKGGVDLVQWVQDQRHFPKSTHNIIDPDLGNSYNPKELTALLNVAKLCINHDDNRSRMYTPQILRYLQKKISIVPK